MRSVLALKRASFNIADVQNYVLLHVPVTAFFIDQLVRQ